jgi:hypothetical protein
MLREYYTPTKILDLKSLGSFSREYVVGPNPHLVSHIYETGYSDWEERKHPARLSQPRSVTRRFVLVSIECSVASDQEFTTIVKDKMKSLLHSEIFFP